MSPIAASLKDLRQARRLSLRQLAAAAGISHVELVHIEAGRVDPRLSTVERLARALEVSLDDLVKMEPAARTRGRGRKQAGRTKR